MDEEKAKLEEKIAELEERAERIVKSVKKGRGIASVILFSFNRRLLIPMFQDKERL